MFRKPIGIPSRIASELRRTPLLGTSVNKGKREALKLPLAPALDTSRLGGVVVVSLSALLAPQMVEGFHHRWRDVGVVVHYLPSSGFTTVDVRHTPINAYRLASDL